MIRWQAKCAELAAILVVSILARALARPCAEEIGWLGPGEDTAALAARAIADDERVQV